MSSKVEPRDYLGGVYPTLLSALSQLGARQPKEPYKWLSQYFLQIHNARTSFTPLKPKRGAQDDAGEATQSPPVGNTTPAGSAVTAVRAQASSGESSGRVASETDFISKSAGLPGVESLASYIGDPHSHSKRNLLASVGEDASWAATDLPHPFSNHHGMWEGFGLVKDFVVSSKRMFIIGKSSLIVVEDYAHRFDWNSIRILKSWPIPLDAVAVTANRFYVAVATRSEVIVYNPDGQKKATLGSKRKKGETADFIAVQLSPIKNMLACIDNSDNSVCVYGLRRQNWVLYARVAETDTIKLHNPLSVSFDNKVNKLWILDLHEGKDYLKVLNFGKFEFEAAHTLHEHKLSKKHRMLGKKSATEKFKELDADGNGYLRGLEMRELAAWVHSSGFDTPKGRQLTGGIPLGKQIMERLDANGDGRLQFSEFKAWFVNNFKNEKLNQQEEDAPDHVPRKICIDKNDNILLLDVGTNCIEVFKVVLKASIDDAGRASKKPVLKLVAELKETIDGKPLENPFSLSLGGKDHVLVGCEDTFLRIPWYGSGASVRNKTRVIRRLGPGDKARDFDTKLADHMHLQSRVTELRQTKRKRISKKYRNLFFDAAKDGNIVALKQMMAKGCELNLVDSAGNNSLSYTLAHNHVRASLTLLSNGALHWNRHVLNTPSVILRTALTSDRFQDQFCKDADDFRHQCTNSSVYTLHSLSAKEEELLATIEEAHRREQRSFIRHSSLSDVEEAEMSDGIANMFKDGDDAW